MVTISVLSKLVIFRVQITQKTHKNYKKIPKYCKNIIAEEIL